MSADEDVDSQIEELQERIQSTSDVAVKPELDVEVVEIKEYPLNDDDSDNCKT